MRIISYKTLANATKTSTTTNTATTTNNNKIIFTTKICHQYGKWRRLHLMSINSWHKHYKIPPPQQQQQQDILQQPFRVYERNFRIIETGGPISNFIQSQRLYGTLRLNDAAVDCSPRYAEQQEQCRPGGQEELGEERQPQQHQQQQQQQCAASYVDVVAAAAAASIGVYTEAPLPAKIDDEKATATALMLENMAVTAALEESSSVQQQSQSRTFAVQLDFELEPHEKVGVTGESAALGAWRLEHSVPLHPEANTNRGVWSANVIVPPAAASGSYRYFIFTEDSTGRRQIRRWETHLQPRTLRDINEIGGNGERGTDRFGVLDDTVADRLEQVKRGWLTTESIVQFKFERERMFRVHSVEKFDAAHVKIKLEPLTQSPHYLGVHVDVARLDYGQSQLKRQKPSGVSYKRGDVLIFHVTVVDLTTHAYRLNFYTPNDELCGRADISPELLTGSEGELELDVVAANASENETPVVLAQLTLPYMIVRPYEQAQLLNFRTTYAHYWPKSWPKLDVGHRGNGRSYIADPPAECENTLASFRRAYDSHADMIELDVHLTADGVPVIYHDFGMRTAARGKEITKADQLEYVLIKDLKYEELKNLRIFAVIKGRPVEYAAHNAEPRIDHRIFPSLRDVLDGLPKTLGIDVEIKWPQRTACGGVEAQQSIDKNFFVDRVLDTIIERGCGRPLIFSSFDADICTMLRFKQNIFPVMFLTMGETKKWSPYMDLRTRNFIQAINNAQAFELAGTAPHAEDFLGEHGAALMEKSIKAGQIAVVWGDDCNSKERVKYFSAIGATAICYDRADLYMPEHKERPFFNSTSLIAEFEAQCPRNGTI